MHRKPKNRQNKVTLVFDEEKRREFLTGFHKRKLQRKKKAQEDLQTQLKEERKRLKTEAKESYKKLVVSHRDIPELTELLKDEFEDENVNVKIVELSTNDISHTNLIGANKVKIEESDSDEEIPGMELKSKKPKVDTPKFISEQEVKKVLKKQATKNIQKSKVFQRKNQIERQKQKKKSLQQKKQRIKCHNKKNKRRP